MPFSVYIAQPPVGGGYGRDIYKVGKTTEEDVQSRVAALNDSGSNYPTANGENWEMVDQFSLASQEQMDVFEDAMMLGLGTGVDPQGTGATELFASTALEVDVHNAALSAIKTLLENGLIDVTAVRDFAAESGPESTGTAMAALPASMDHLTEDVVGLIAEFVWDALPWALPALGIGVAVWRGKRIYGWMKRRRKDRLEYWRATAPPRPPEPSDITEADKAFERARAAKKKSSGPRIGLYPWEF